MSSDNIPVDEMIDELRASLEQLDREPTFANFDKVQKETIRIERRCEDAVFEYLDVNKENEMEQVIAEDSGSGIG